MAVVSIIIVFALLIKLVSVDIRTINRIFCTKILKNEIRGAILGAFILIMLVSLPILLIKTCNVKNFIKKQQKLLTETKIK